MIKAAELARSVSRAGLDLWLRTLGSLNLAPLFDRDPRRVVVFQAFSTHLAQCYQPLIERLRAEEPELRLVLQILLHPHVPLAAARDLYMYARNHLKFRPEDVGYYWRQIWNRCDLLVCTDVFARFPARAGRTVLLPHGSGLMPRMFEPHPFRKSMADFDLTLVAGAFDLDSVRQLPQVQPYLERLQPIGFPFLDRLAKPPLARDAYIAKLGLDPSLPIVLFAPHWTALRNEGAPAYVEEVVTALETLPINRVLKLHSCSLYPSMSGGINWASILCELSRNGRVRIDDAVEDLSALAHADLLITDYSSRSFVFMAMEKPLVLMSPRQPDVVEEAHDRMALMRGASALARSGDELVARTLDALATRTPQPTAPAVGERCYSNFGRATGPVVAALVAELRGRA